MAVGLALTAALSLGSVANAQMLTATVISKMNNKLMEMRNKCMTQQMDLKLYNRFMDDLGEMQKMTGQLHKNPDFSDMQKEQVRELASMIESQVRTLTGLTPTEAAKLMPFQKILERIGNKLNETVEVINAAPTGRGFRSTVGKGSTVVFIVNGTRIEPGQTRETPTAPGNVVKIRALAMSPTRVMLADKKETQRTKFTRHDNWVTSWDYTDVGFTGTARWEVTREKYRWTPSKKGTSQIYNSNIYRSVESDMIRWTVPETDVSEWDKLGSFTFYAGYNMDWRYERKSTQGANVEKTPPTETGSGYLTIHSTYSTQNLTTPAPQAPQTPEVPQAPQEPKPAPKMAPQTQSAPAPKPSGTQYFQLN